jgi:hypothetical protein
MLEIVIINRNYSHYLPGTTTPTLGAIYNGMEPDSAEALAEGVVVVVLVVVIVVGVVVVGVVVVVRVVMTVV